jgi:uncharacterized BrkB/YihY/UPF0761 family membrane protein
MEEVSATRRPKRRWLATVLWVLITAITAITAVTVLPMSLMLVMVFDAPSSTQVPWLWMLLIGALSFVPLCALVPLLLWLLYGLGLAMPARRRSIRRLGHGLHLLPLLSPLTMLMAVLGLEWACRGQFTCGR